MELYQSLNVNSKNVGKLACETREIQFYCAALVFGKVRELIGVIKHAPLAFTTTLTLLDRGM